MIKQMRASYFHNFKNAQYCALSNDPIPDYLENGDQVYIIDQGKIYYWDELSSSLYEYKGRGEGGSGGSSSFIPCFGSLATVQLGTTWSGDDPYTSTVTVTGYTVTSKTMVSVLPSDDVIEQMLTDGITNIFITNNDGVLTATAIGAIPTVPMTLQVLCTESDISGDIAELPSIVGSGVIETVEADNLTDAVNILGNEVSELSRQLSDKQKAPSTAGTAGQVLGLDDQLQPVWVNQSGGGDVSNCAPIIINTASGDVVSFDDGANSKPIKKIIANFTPVQDGIPTPDNKIAINGWTGCTLCHNENTYNIEWGNVANILYGGTLTINEDGSVDIVSTYYRIDGGDQNWVKINNSDYRNFRFTWSYAIHNSRIPTVMSEAYKPAASSNGATAADDNYVWIRAATGSDDQWCCVKDTSHASLSAAQFKALMTGVKFVALVDQAHQASYHLASIDQLTTFLGNNRIWADLNGSVSVDYCADTKLYIDSQIANTRKLIAGIEAAYTATRAYSIGDLLIVGDNLYKVTAVIASGATIIIGTNVAQTTVAEQLIALANA